MLDAIVVGAGPAGSVAALVMARAGARVLILDRAVCPRDVFCGDLLSPGAVQLLGTLGIDPLPLFPHVVRGWRVTTARGRVFQCLAGAFQPLSISRPAFDAMLLDLAIAAGARFQSGVIVRGPLVDQPAGRVRGVVAVSSGSEVRLPAAMVIAADGRRSALARRAGLRLLVPDRSRACGTYATNVSDISGHVEIHVGAEAYCRMTPVAADRVNVHLVTRTGRGRDAALLLAAFMRDHPQLSARFGVLSPAELRWSGAIETRTRAPGVTGLLLAGDAAGTVSPVTGEGIRLAMLGGQLAGLEALHAIESGEFDGAAARLALARHQAMAKRQRVARRLDVGMKWPAVFEAGAVVARLMPGLMPLIFDDAVSAS